jgi:outer membrane protein assembly factor BamB
LQLYDLLRRPPRLVLAAVLAAAGGRAGADDWPTWLGPAGDGSSRETGWLKDWPPAGPPRLFEKAIGEGYSAVAVAGGRLILFHRVRDEIRVECLDPLTGEERWRFGYPTDYTDRYGYNGGPRCAPIVHGIEGKQLVLALGPTGSLHALELETGKVVWVRELEKELGLERNFFGVGAAPVAGGKLLHVNLGGVDTGTGLAVALDASTGAVAWKSPTDGGAYAAPCLASVGGEPQLFIFHRGGLSAFDPPTGREKWKFPWRSRLHESVNAATPLVVGDVLLFSSTYGMGAVTLRVKKDTFEVLWKDDPALREKKLDIHWSTPNVAGGVIYGFAGRHEEGSALRAVELLTGKVLWSWESYLGRGSMLHSDGHFIALGERGDLALLELGPAGHREVRRVPRVLRYPAWTPPVLSNGILYLRDESRLIAMDLRVSRAAGAETGRKGE